MGIRRIVYISPGGSGLYDGHYRQVLNHAAFPGTKVDCIHLILEEKDTSPFLSPYPFYHSELFRTINKAADDGYQAAIIGCSADPGLVEARRMTGMPVVAPLEANLHLASMLRKPVTVLVPGRREQCMLYWNLAQNYRLERSIASILPVDLHYPPSHELAKLMQEDPDQLREIILGCHRSSLEGDVIRLARKAIEDDGAGVIYCGCTLWAGMLDPLAKELGVPVLDAAIGALRMAEVLAAQASADCELTQKTESSSSRKAAVEATG